MGYTIEDLKGKYVKYGTPEAEVFLDACEELGVLWVNGLKAKSIQPGVECFSLKYNGFLCAGIPSIDCNVPFTPKSQWSIYTNDKPLCELSDEQASALFNAWRSGCAVEYFISRDTRWDESFPEWLESVTYRIKQKSECELFVEKCVKSINSHNSDDPAYYEEWFEQLFNVGCRFTKD